MAMGVNGSTLRVSRNAARRASMLSTSRRDSRFHRFTVKNDVAPGIHMLVGHGGNIGVSTGSDGVFLIDDQFAPLSEGIRAAVAAISDAPLRFLLNTHWHGDHTGGNENFAGLGAVIVAHDNVRRRMSTEQLMAALDRSVPASPQAALPVVTFGADVTFHWNGDAIHAIKDSEPHDRNQAAGRPAVGSFPIFIGQPRTEFHSVPVAP